MASLKRAGAIDYHRGKLSIRDRAALKATACPCYAITAAQFARLDAEAGQT